ncbi:hypothetical protein G6F55_014492 [Rhizopus delemar]|nr:hypothetical protein G6F55_014492 [Rhizopus delemar]
MLQQHLRFGFLAQAQHDHQRQGVGIGHPVDAHALVGPVRGAGALLQPLPIQVIGQPRQTERRDVVVGDARGVVRARQRHAGHEQAGRSA